MKQVLLLIAMVVLVGCGTTKLTPPKAFTNTLGMKFVPVSGTEVAFCIWESRVKDYAAYAAANAGVDGSWKKPGFKQEDTHPVVKVSWNDAQAFCEWLTKKELAEGKIKAGQKYRLPTDAEWSVAVVEIGQPNTAVFVSRTGAKYHREDCRFVSKSKQPTTLQRALGKNTACGVCGPPMLKSVAKPPAADMKKKVFVTRTGGTYPRDGCRFLAKSKIEMALGLARQKYRPCSRCAPPK